LFDFGGEVLSEKRNLNDNRWYKLDNAAKIYPAISSNSRSNVFRVAVHLKQEVDKDILNAALRITLPRFPAFAVKIKKGLFWYYFDPNDNIPEADIEKVPICGVINSDETNGFLFRVSYFKTRISLEIFHSITDGIGAVAFLKTLIFQYLTISGYDIASDDSILHCEEHPSVSEYEDSFNNYYDSSIKSSWAEQNAYKIAGTRKAHGSISVIHGILKTEAMLTLAKSAGATVTEYIAALLIFSIYSMRLIGRGSKLPVKISIPVNLRKIFPSRTLRNFSSYVNIGMPFSREPYSFEQILENICMQMKEELKPDKFITKISANVNAEKNIFMRIAPLILKNVVLKTAYNMFGDNLITSSLSNIGVVSVPEDMKRYIERFEFVLGAPVENMLNCAVCSFDGELVISFTRIMEEIEIDKFFFRFLAAKGIDLIIETN
jgi:NRPS condensation-like uncharacterized protein